MTDRRPSSVNVVAETCVVCTKVAYPMESIKADGKVYHKTCFRCAKCNNVLSLGNYAAVEGATYCKPHFKELFKLKGNYTEGFRDASATATPTDEAETSTTPPPSTSPVPTSVSSSPAPASPAPGTDSSSSESLDRKALRTQRTMSPSMPIKNATCAVCQQTVYAMDKISADSVEFHKACFRCAECNNVLRLGNYAALAGKYYCKPHFKQLFALKGNYDEGFGRTPHKMNWVEGAESPATEAAAAP